MELFITPLQVTGAEASSSGNVSTVTPHMMVQCNCITLGTPSQMQLSKKRGSLSR